MKKKTVVLCDLCSEDRLAVNILHIGVCTDHDARIAALTAQSLTPAGPGTIRRRRVVTRADKAKMRELYKTMKLTEVAETMGFSISTVMRHVPSRRKGG